nr:hypothetical protein [Streptomyces sp. DSM 41633]
MAAFGRRPVRQGKDSDGTEETQGETADGGRGSGGGDEHAGGRRSGGRGTGTAPGPDEPTIRWTEYGIPHIIASDWEGL